QETPSTIDGRRGDPDVIGRDRSAGASKGGVNHAVSPGDILRRGQDRNERFFQKIGQRDSVLLGTARQLEGAFELPKNSDRKKYELGAGEKLDDPGVSDAKMGVG